MKNWDAKLKIVLLILTAALCFWVCCRAHSQPLPPKIKPALQSPKGAEFNKSLAIVKPAVIVVLPRYITNTLYWTNYSTHWVELEIQWKPEITSPWMTVGRVTNKSSFVYITTTPRSFFQVGAYWP